MQLLELDWLNLVIVYIFLFFNPICFLKGAAKRGIKQYQTFVHYRRGNKCSSTGVALEQVQLCSIADLNYLKFTSSEKGCDSCLKCGF